MDDFNKAIASLQSVGGVPEIDKLYEPEYAASLASNQTREMGARADVDVANAGIARQDRIAKLEAELDEVEAMRDPSKYQKIKRQDGGFDFFNPKGEKISAGVFAQVQGKNIADVLEDSDNLEDNIFREGYAGIKAVAQAFELNDKESLVKALGGKLDKETNRVEFASKEGEKIYKDFQEGMTVEEYTKKFIETFRDKFGPTSIGGAPAGKFEGLDSSINQPNIGDRFRGFINSINPFGGGLDTDPDR